MQQLLITVYMSNSVIQFVAFFQYAGADWGRPGLLVHLYRHYLIAS